MEGFARLGPGPRYTLPAGGFCLSSFALLEKRGKILLVKPNRHEKWAQEWAPNFKIYAAEQMEKEMNYWRFPSTYIKQGEHPDSALKRIVEDQLGVKEYAAGKGKLYNFYDPSNLFPGKMHWDYCFVYKISTGEPITKKSWLSQVEYVKTKGMDPKEFGSAQGDLAKGLRLL